MKNEKNYGRTCQIWQYSHANVHSSSYLLLSGSNKPALLPIGSLPNRVVAFGDATSQTLRGQQASGVDPSHKATADALN